MQRRLIVSSVIVMGFGLWAAPRLLPLQVPSQRDQALTVLDRHGVWLGTLLSRDQEHTAVVPLESVSPYFIEAIIAAEDHRFYQHGGVDAWALLRAIAQNQRAGRVVSGASTVTMQLARLLDPAPRTLSSKLQEVWRAWRLEAGMSKDEILAAYINRLPMGGNIYGVEAAAQLYFGTRAAQLTAAQATLLAAMPQNPQVFSRDRSAWQQRQAYVIGQMLERDRITPEVAYQALRTPVDVLPRQEGIAAAPHFLVWLASTAPETSLIRSSLDLELQTFVSGQVQALARSHQNINEAAAIVVDNASGAVLAYVGAPHFETSQTDGVQALRQPGSTLKPFLYALAIEQGLIEPRSILADIPTHYALPEARVYSPVDFSETFQGPVRVRLALANSLNLPAVRLLEQVGVPTFLDFLQRLGFANLTQPPEFYGLGLALGSGEVSLWQLAQAFRTVVSEGDWRPLSAIAGAPSQEGQPQQLGSAATWQVVTDMLADPQARSAAFGTESWLNLPFASAVKTGTSSQFRDNWTVGSSARYTVAVWVGNFNGQPLLEADGTGIAGSDSAAPLWHRIMLHLHPDLEGAAWPEPEGYQRLPICAWSGQRPQTACPLVVNEWVRDREQYDQEQDSTFTTVAGQLQINLPPLYEAWLRQQQTAGLHIITPQPEATYLQSGELVFRTNQTEAVTWVLNGQELGSGTVLRWSLEPGQWILEARTPGATDRVNFWVLDTLPNRVSGFSIR